MTAPRSAADQPRPVSGARPLPQGALRETRSRRAKAEVSEVTVLHRNQDDYFTATDTKHTLPAPSNSRLKYWRSKEKYFSRGPMQYQDILGPGSNS